MKIEWKWVDIEGRGIADAGVVMADTHEVTSGVGFAGHWSVSDCPSPNRLTVNWILTNTSPSLTSDLAKFYTVSERFKDLKKDCQTGSSRVSFR